MLILLLGCADPVLQLDGDAVRGDELYQVDCTLCHGTTGEGTSRGPVLTEIEDRLARSLILEVIRDGRGDMPPSTLEDQELADVLAYLKGL